MMRSWSSTWPSHLELISEGMARDVVRIVQQARKESGLNVSDRIQLFLPLGGEWGSALEVFHDYICEQTLASELHINPLPGNPGNQSEKTFAHTAQFGGNEVQFFISRVSD